MKVIAAPGLKCPQEDKPREYITDTEATEVPDTAYYVRLVNDGSLMTAISKDDEPQNKKLKADT